MRTRNWVLKSQTAGLLSMVAALLVPSWWMFLQVLAGLGTVAVVSAGCFVWLRRFQPFVAFLAITALLYQAWLVRRQPAHQRTRMMLAILWTSVATTVVMGAAMLIVSRRYR